jgi:hypothetical protein
MSSVWLNSTSFTFLKPPDYEYFELPIGPDIFQSPRCKINPIQTFLSFLLLSFINMGLLSLGTPLHWNDAQQYADHVRAHGIDQFLTTYKKEKDQKNQHLLWGDEVGQLPEGSTRRYLPY